MARLLRSWGFGVLTFLEAEQVLESDKVHEVSCIVIDIQLPGMSGFELQARLHDRRLPAPVVFMSALDDRQISILFDRHEPVMYLRKPFDPHELLEAIQLATGL